VLNTCEGFSRRERRKTKEKKEFLKMGMSYWLDKMKFMSIRGERIRLGGFKRHQQNFEGPICR